MHHGLESLAFSTSDMSRLSGVVEVVSAEPLHSFSGDEARKTLGLAEILVSHWGCPRLDAEVLDAAPALDLVVHAAGSVKEIVSPELWRRGVRVSSAAQANARPTAEFSLAMILLSNKKVWIAREEFRDGNEIMINSMFDDVGNVSCRVGLVGASRVGRIVIELLDPFDLEVAVFDPYLDNESAASLGVTRCELDELMSTSSVVSLHVPELPETRHLIGAHELSLMRDGTTLVNSSRGSVVDPAALEAELVASRINAVLDVTDPEPLPRSSPLWRLPNVFLTPHVAGSQGRELARLSDFAISEIERYVREEPLLGEVRESDLSHMA